MADKNASLGFEQPAAEFAAQGGGYVFEDHDNHSFSWQQGSRGAGVISSAPLQLFFFVAFDAAPEAGGEGRVGVYVAVWVNGLGSDVG